MLAALVAADLVVGRAGSSTLAEVDRARLPMVVVPYPHAAGHQRANARVLVDAGAARLIEDEAFDAARCSTRRRILDDPARHLAMSAAARALGRPAAADAVAELVMAAAERRPLPDRDDDRPAVAGECRMTAPDRPPFDAIAIGTEIQRRIGVKTSRDEPLARFTTMRVGGPADLFATPHNRSSCASSSSSPAAATCRTSSWGGGATWSSPTPASAGWSSRSAPRASASTGSR